MLGLGLLAGGFFSKRFKG
ncbi:MAG: hypothetical protein ACE10C_00885 [Candidatus Binatia bacterium]